MPEIVYGLCAAMSLVCATLLLRGFLRTRSRLLLWASLSFGFYALNSMFLYVDMAIFPNIDSSGPFWRNLLGAISGSLLVFGLIWEIE